MIKLKNLGWAIAISCLIFSLVVPSSLFAAAAPKPGTVINSSNAQQYKEFFPEEFMEAFTTGWGLIRPLTLTMTETKPNPIPKVFLDVSEKNKGKYGVDAEGYITGGPCEEIVGYPFPDVTPDDQQFALKYFWNYDYRYYGDDVYATFTNWQKRRGEETTTSDVESFQLFYQNRMFDDPKPNYETSTGWRSVNLLRILTPPSTRNLINSLIRFKDQKKDDLTYIYLPTLRRVLRGEAGQRSTPIASSTQAPDDFSGGFSGRIADFTYTYIGEKPMIVLEQSKLTYTAQKDLDQSEVFIESDGWEVKDCYIFDIVPKDSKYPQSKKRIWIIKETGNGAYCMAWDRAGALWKVWHTAGAPVKLQTGGGNLPFMTGMIGIDIQLGYVVQMYADWKYNGNNIRESDVNTAAIRKMAR